MNVRTESPARPEFLFSRDAFSAFTIASRVQSKGRVYQLMSVSQTNYSRLRHAPLVAIGAFNNSGLCE
jgi:hypothetical protein